MLANYTELQAEIADTLHRDDLTAKIPSFIALFETRANRYLNAPQQEVTTDLTLASGSKTIALPSDFLEPLDAVLFYGVTPCKLQQVQGRFIDETFPITSIPVYYAINNGSINFGVYANQDYTVRLRYLKKWNLAADITNWLLTNHPDAYLYGSLAASAAYIGEDERLPLWKELAGNAIDEINRQGAQNRKTDLMTETQQMKGQRWNIIRGY